MDTTNQIRALAAHADQRGTHAVAFLRDLVRVRSDNPPGDCAPHAEHTASLIERLGLAVERHPVPDSDVRAVGMRSATNLIVRHRFGSGGPTVALNAHGDVVAPGEGWSSDPYAAEIRDGRIYGRGAAVSKSDFATYVFALLALRDTGLVQRGAVELHLTYDEETGGEIGPAWLLQRGLSRPDYVISAGFAHSIMVAHNGCLHLQATIRGKSAHAARPETGHDALEAATSVLQTLYELRKGFAGRVSAVPGVGHPNLVVGLISGGINTNVVPDTVTLRIDRRIVPDESAAEAEAELRAVIAAAIDGRPGIRADVERILLAGPLTAVPGQEHIVAALGDACRMLEGDELPTEGVPIYTDARHYSEAGIPTVGYGAGPRTLLEANGHRADENVKLTDLARATRVVTAATARLLQEA
jgi:succinyl-diaminopimelate desuccinylase